MKKVKSLGIAFIAIALLSVILSQTSCKKLPAKDAPDPGIETKSTTILYRINYNDTNELWSVKNDGSDKHKVNIVLPAGLQLDNEDMAEVSSDGQMMVFLARNDAAGEKSIFKCNIDGTNVVRVTNPVKYSLGIQALINKTAVLYWKEVSDTDYALELWSVNIDGTNDHNIHIALPAGLILQEEELAKVTSDGKNIVLLAKNTTTGEKSIYKCNIDGSNPVLVTSETSIYFLAIQSLTNDNTILYRKAPDLEPYELWSVNIDGTSKHKINFVLPSNVELQGEEMAKGTKDGILYFSTTNVSTHKVAIYTAKADGSNIKAVTEEALDYDIAIQAIY
jgi:invasion protein IalB